MKLQVKKNHPDAVVPQYALANDAGLDMVSIEEVTIAPHSRVAIATGLSIAVPHGHAALVWDKSGRALNDGLTTMAGVIDSGYRGEVLVVMLNTTTEPITVPKGQKIAQILLQKVEQAQIEEVDELDTTERGDRGFGSTDASV